MFCCNKQQQETTSEEENRILPFVNWTLQQNTAQSRLPYLFRKRTTKRPSADKELTS